MGWIPPTGKRFAGIRVWLENKSPQARGRRITRLVRVLRYVSAGKKVGPMTCIPKYLWERLPLVMASRAPSFRA